MDRVTWLTAVTSQDTGQLSRYTYVQHTLETGPFFTTNGSCEFTPVKAKELLGRFGVFILGLVPTHYFLLLSK